MDDQVLINARADPNYCPYCLRCSGLVRMYKVCEFGWRCGCGAQCDYREGHNPTLPPLNGQQMDHYKYLRRQYPDAYRRSK